jgi:hypothetical protein
MRAHDDETGDYIEVGEDNDIDKPKLSVEETNSTEEAVALLEKSGEASQG